MSTEKRYQELKKILEDRRTEIQASLPRFKEEEKANSPQDGEEFDEPDSRDDIESALMQMKKETLQKLNDAINRLEAGTYGKCFECGQEISERRLRALPFAVRCKDCEDKRQAAEEERRSRERRQPGGNPFLNFD